MERQAQDTNPKIEYPQDWQDTILDEMVASSMFYPRDRFKVIDVTLVSDLKPNWLSIRKAKNCLFSRRHGHMGKLIWGYSICLRLFGKTIL